MRSAVVALVCSLPVCGCLVEPQAGAGAQGARDLAQFEAAVRQTASEPAHTAVALAAAPDRLFWGAAAGAATPAEARTLALSRCTVNARLSGFAVPCSLYAADGRVLYLERN